jgi:hypothetical protein
MVSNMKASELEAYYQSLGLEANASLKEIDDAYFQLRGQMICAGKREDIAPIKAAHDSLKRHLLTSATPSTNPTLMAHKPAEPNVIEPNVIESNVIEPRKAFSSPFSSSLSSPKSLTEMLAHQGITARASIREQTLHLGITVSPTTSAKQITSQIYELFSEIDPADYALGPVAIVRLYGLESGPKNGPKNGPKTLWKETFPLPNLQPTADDADLYSFNNRFSNTLIFPGLLLIAALLNTAPAIQLLLFGVNIWVHECGHATVAWLGGYKAIPLPFGWTNIGAEQSLFVYFGVLTLLGLLFWTGHQEQRRWPMVLACILAVVQFYMTWIISEDTFYMLFSFGGVGGEFYLSTLLIVSFYWPLPAKWRWDFYRYPAVLFAGFTFLGSLGRWRQIKSGVQAIPWGTLFGGSGDAGGDMNQLVDHGWSDQRIVDCYNSLGGLCLIVIVSVYAYFFLKQRNHLFLYALWRRWRTSA